jgi:hypothetical protein
MEKSKEGLFLLFFLFLFSCVSTNNIPAFRDLNVSLKSMIKSNSTISATIHFSSRIQDDIIIPYKQDKSEIISGHSGYTLSENALFHNMLNQYMILKFPSIKTENEIDLYFNIIDFWIEEYSTNIFGQQRSALSEMIVGNITGNMKYTISAKLIINVIASYNGNEVNKIINISSDTTYDKIVNNKTSESNNNRFTESIQTIHGRNINILNNRALRELNKLFEELGI